MVSRDTDKVFAGSIPKLYDTHLVPLIFEPYAADLVESAAFEDPVARARDCGRHGCGDSCAGIRAARTRLHRRHGPESADARPGRRSRDEAPGRVASGGRHAAAFRGRSVRRRRLPVRRHVLPRQGQGVCGGASRAQAGRRFPLQRVGSDRGKRIRGHRDDGARIRLSRRSAALPGPHAPRLPRPRRHRARSCKRRLHGVSPNSTRLRRAAGRSRPRSRRSRTARARRYGTRSRRATPSRLGEATDVAAEAIARRFGPGPVDGKIQAHIVTIEAGN